jgi:hypothetical protein
LSWSDTTETVVKNHLIPYGSSAHFNLLWDVEEGENRIVQDGRAGFSLDSQVVPCHSETFGRVACSLIFLFYLEDLYSVMRGQRRYSAHLISEVLLVRELTSSSIGHDDLIPEGESARLELSSSISSSVLGVY